MLLCLRLCVGLTGLFVFDCPSRSIGVWAGEGLARSVSRDATFGGGGVDTMTLSSTFCLPLICESGVEVRDLSDWLPAIWGVDEDVHEGLKDPVCMDCPFRFASIYADWFRCIVVKGRANRGSYILMEFDRIPAFFRGTKELKAIS